MTGGPSVERMAPGTFSVTSGGTRQTVYVAGTAGDRWAFWNGVVFRATEDSDRSTPAGRERPGGRCTLYAPMPATVIKVLAAPGARMSKGETVVLLEAMKMELPIRATDEGTVTAVHCREGELVAADQPLVELE